jgi:hypothetical protein
MSNLGNGINRSSARPVRVKVGRDGEYWLCDADVEHGVDYARAGCTAHSSVPMAEGG